MNTGAWVLRVRRLVARRARIVGDLHSAGKEPALHFQRQVVEHRGVRLGFLAIALFDELEASQRRVDDGLVALQQRYEFPHRLRVEIERCEPLGGQHKPLQRSRIVCGATRKLSRTWLMC